MVPPTANQLRIGLVALGSLFREARLNPENFRERVPNAQETLNHLASALQDSFPENPSLKADLQSSDPFRVSQALAIIGSRCMTQTTGPVVTLARALRAQPELLDPGLFSAVVAETNPRAKNLLHPLVPATYDQTKTLETVSALRELRDLFLLGGALVYFIEEETETATHQLACKWLIWTGLDAYPVHNDLTVEGLDRLIKFYHLTGQREQAAALEQQTVASYLEGVQIPQGELSRLPSFFVPSLSILKQALAETAPPQKAGIYTRVHLLNLKLLEGLTALILRYPNIKDRLFGEQESGLTHAREILEDMTSKAVPTRQQPSLTREDLQEAAERILQTSPHVLRYHHESLARLRSLERARFSLDKVLNPTNRDHFLNHLEFFLVTSPLEDTDIGKMACRILIANGRKEHLLKITIQSLKETMPVAYPSEGPIDQSLVDRGITLAGFLERDGTPLLGLLYDIVEKDKSSPEPIKYSEIFDPPLTHRLKAALAICEIGASILSLKNPMIES